MTQEEFYKHIPILQENAFEIYPEPEQLRPSKFILSNWNGTHAMVRSQHGNADFSLSYSLIDIINPGIVKLVRTVSIRNNSFI